MHAVLGERGLELAPAGRDGLGVDLLLARQRQHVARREPELRTLDGTGRGRSRAGSVSVGVGGSTSRGLGRLRRRRRFGLRRKAEPVLVLVEQLHAGLASSSAPRVAPDRPPTRKRSPTQAPTASNAGRAPCDRGTGQGRQRATREERDAEDDDQQRGRSPAPNGPIRLSSGAPATAPRKPPAPAYASSPRDRDRLCVDHEVEDAADATAASTAPSVRLRARSGAGLRIGLGRRVGRDPRAADQLHPGDHERERHDVAQQTDERADRARRDPCPTGPAEWA